jgi:uncharacterized HAD superfamily protein
MDNTKLNIGIDIDGVIIDFIDEFIRFYRKKYPRFRKLRKSHIRSYDLGSILGLQRDEINELVEHTIINGKFELNEGADRVLREISGDNIYICTSRPPRHHDRTLKMLDNFDIPYRKILFKPEGRKLEALLMEMPGFDLFIEDNVAEAIRLSRLVKQVLVFKQPWNEGCLNVRRTLKYVNNWDEILTAVNYYKSNNSPTIL